MSQTLHRPSTNRLQERVNRLDAYPTITTLLEILSVDHSWIFTALKSFFALTSISSKAFIARINSSFVDWNNRTRKCIVSPLFIRSILTHDESGKRSVCHTYESKWSIVEFNALSMSNYFAYPFDELFLVVMQINDNRTCLQRIVLAASSHADMTRASISWKGWLNPWSIHILQAIDMSPSPSLPNRRTTTQRISTERVFVVYRALIGSTRSDCFANAWIDSWWELMECWNWHRPARWATAV